MMSKARDKKMKYNNKQFTCVSNSNFYLEAIVEWYILTKRKNDNQKNGSCYITY